MSRFACLCLAVLAACTQGSDISDTGTAIGDGSPVVPDTVTVDGVLVMHHDATAYARAPRWTLDAEPLLVYGGGDDPDFDLSNVPGVQQPFLLPDGRLVAIPLVRRNGILLFRADGTPERVLAPIGEGPGMISQGFELMAFPAGDTVLVFDGTRRRVSAFTADRGLVGEQRWEIDPQGRCRTPHGLLSSKTQVVLACFPVQSDWVSERPSSAYGITDRTLRATAVALQVPGAEVRYRTSSSHGGTERLRVVLGLESYVATWDTLIVSATQERGYELMLLTPDGTPRGRITMDVARRPVTAAIRNAFIQRDLDRAKRESEHGGIPVAELQKRAHEMPIADSMPWIGGLRVGTDGLLWVLDPATLGDTTWSATAFRSDGTLMGRLTAPGAWNEGPAWFGKGRVLVRRVDLDGVVRFGLYQIGTQVLK